MSASHAWIAARVCSVISNLMLLDIVWTIELFPLARPPESPGSPSRGFLFAKRRSCRRQRMIDILDQGRAARGLPPLYTKSAEDAARAPGGIFLPRQ